MGLLVRFDVAMASKWSTAQSQWQSGHTTDYPDANVSLIANRRRPIWVIVAAAPVTWRAIAVGGPFRARIRGQVSPSSVGPMEDGIHRALGLTDDEYASIVAILGRAPNHLELAMYSVMWSEHCSYKSSRVHLKRLPTEAPWVLVGPGRERRRGRRRRRHRRRHPHREPQPPVGHRALPGRGHRRRRHPPRHLHHGRPPDRADGPAAVRPARRRPQPLDRRGRRVGHLRLRQLGRRAHRRRRDRLRRDLRRATRSSTCSASACCPPSGSCSARPRASATSPCCSARPPAATASAASSVLASAGFSDDEADADKRPSVQVGDPFEEKRLIEACLALLDAGLVVGIQDLGGAGLTCATSETASRGGDGHGRRRHRRPPPRAGHGAVRGHDQRVPGAHARHRRARRPRRGARHLRALGGPGHRDRQGHPARHGDARRPPAHPRRLRRRGARRRARRVPPRGRPALRPAPRRARRRSTRPRRAAGRRAARARQRRRRRRPARPARRHLVGVVAVRPPALPQHRRGPRRRRRGAAPQAPGHRRRHRPRPGPHHRRQPPLVRRRPPRRARR